MATTNRDYQCIVGIASSAGGLKALSMVLADIPAGFRAPIVIVQHLDPHHPSQLAHVLARGTKLTVKQAEEGDRLMPGAVLVAPPDRHLLVNPEGTVSLSQSALVHFVRPSADLLFDSMAASHGREAIGVVLSGGGVDGSVGIRAIKQSRGTVIAQDPATAEFPSMPRTAVRSGCVDLILPLEQIAAQLVTLVTTGESRDAPVD